MSYLVLARKYRPAVFSELVGQMPVVTALSNALISKRLHHAYLFTGTRGVGKTTVSRILAKSLNCLGSDGAGDVTATPCGACSACQQIDAGRFADYIELDAASNRGVEDIQTLLDQSVYKPTLGRYKVFMIDEVHMLSNTAFNAMLKTLEEPPGYLKFVLATTDPKKVPITVLSRCLQLNLRPLPPPAIAAQLGKVLKAEALPFAESALALIARAAQGSMRDALSLTDQAIAFCDGNLEAESVRTMLGAVDKNCAFALLQAQAQGDGHTLVTLVEQLRAQGYSAYAALDEMTEILLALAVQQFAPDSGSHSTNPANEESATQLAQLGALLARDEAQLLYSMLLQGRQELGLAPDEYAGLTMVLLRFLAFQDLDEAKPKVSVKTESKTPKPVIETKVVLAPTHTSSVPERTAAEHSNAQEVAKTPGIGAAPASASKKKPIDAVISAPEPNKPLVLPVQVPPQESRLEQKIGARPPGTNHVWWEATVQHLLSDKQITALARELALQTQCIEKNDAHIVLRVEQRTLINERARERLQQTLAELGIDASLRLELGPVLASRAKTLEAEHATKLAAAHKQLESDPLVQALTHEFSAHIVENSVQCIH